MSDKLEIVELPDDELQGDQKQNQFVAKFVLRRARIVIDTSRSRVPRTTNNDRRTYEIALRSATRNFAAADKLAQELAQSQSVAQERDGYLNAAQLHEQARPEADYKAALVLLNARLTAAGKLLNASAKRDIRLVKSRQVEAQGEQYRELGEEMGNVKASCITPGTGTRIEKNLPGAGERRFTPVLQAVRGLEVARQELKPKLPATPEQAGQVKQSCAALILAAQTFLNESATLVPMPEGKALDILNSQKRECLVLIQQARHLALAMEHDLLPRPTPEAPWDDEQQIRATGLQNALAFERGGQVATSLDGKGASTSYWIREKSVPTLVQEQGSEQPGKGERMFIFKPNDGEETPDGGSDRKGAGAIKEALASANSRLFAQQTGIDLGVPETSVVSIDQSALEGGDPGKPPLLGSAQRNAGGQVGEMRETDPELLRRVPKEDIHKLALLDIMSLSCDRHDGNVMVDTTDPQAPRLVPIDHGASLPSRVDFPALAKRLGGIVQKMNSTGIMNVLLTNPVAYEPFDPKMLAQLSRLDPEAMEQGMKQQREALGRVHPGLNPEDKVGDESLHMSKRAMMFTKLAARTLSPAEIQIAIANFGPALFDAEDDDFDAVARRIIKEQAPKKDAYLEVMFLSQEDMSAVAVWLSRNGWGRLDRAGTPDGADFLMKDPVNALKLYKTKTANPNPPPKPPVRGKDAISPVSGEAPDEETQREIDRQFPNLTNKWEDIGPIWPDVVQLGGGDEYQRMLEATQAAPATAIQYVRLGLDLWDQVKRAGKQGNLVLGASTMSAVDKLRFALAQDEIEQYNAQQQLAAVNIGSQITDETSRTASVDEQFVQIGTLIDRISDILVKQPLAEQLMAAKLKAEQGDPKGAEKDLFAMKAAAIAAEQDDLRQQYVLLYGQFVALADRKLWPEGMNKESEKQIQAASNRTFDEAMPEGRKQRFEGLRALYRKLRGWDDDPNAQNQPPLQPQPELVEVVEEPVNDNQEEHFDDEEEEDVLPPQPEPEQPDDGPKGPLAAFEWRERHGRSVVEFAVANGYFKKQSTGLGAQIRAVKDARKKLESIKPTTSIRRQTEWLENAEVAYHNVGVFVASRLRLLSDRPNWVGYCNLVADEVGVQLAQVRQRLQVLRR